MSSKKLAAVKRAKLPRASDLTRQFVKDWERLTHSGRHDMMLLNAAMLLLVANEAPLDPEWLDHALKGEWTDHRECHIGGEILLIYRVQGRGAGEQVTFVRAGSHSELFGG